MSHRAQLIGRTIIAVAVLTFIVVAGYNALFQSHNCDHGWAPKNEVCSD